ncbi:MAG: TIGR00730 family Rossman fold protein [Planctomycetota bacterium]|nr:MAG: TIGR00730 family Rossman fold protein [Planctomycetota bacterium]REJ92761.1 MAG: TIGR00730 family Rossman fold protein [Planctomycetota bacterium]REK23796.1 MAG: TIGR00730 family Rossman fold protein [Planctomycetota bacterium]REK47649.1 MAG: TIGR00730 family Rossman fold protein [Planctomycetota bacterium]
MDQVTSGDGEVGEVLHPDPSRRRQIGDLIERIKESADKLQLDNTSRGDLKILSRTLRELRYAFKVFSPYRGRRKVTVFGSARTRPDEPAYQQAVRFGEKIVQHEWFVVTGAASGIMEAGHRGAGRENSMGLNIMLPFEQDANPIIRGDEKLVHMKYFFTRKLMFVKECHAVCCLPGGFGTLDEGLEVLTLLQTGKRDIIPCVFLDAPGQTFWQDFLNFVENRLLDDRMISPEDLSLYKYTDDVDEAVEEILNFYRVYHSMRYARDKLVLRLNEPISDELLDELNANFGDILSSGRIDRSEMLSAEKDEADLADLPRLVLKFNRRSLGRLRELVDSLNLGRIAPSNA